jgi:hypothetical protein
VHPVREDDEIEVGLEPLSGGAEGDRYGLGRLGE